MNFQMNWEKYIEYNLGLFLYVTAVLSLIYYKLNDKKIIVPGPFFLLLGLGGLSLFFNALKLDKPTPILVLRLFMALGTLFLYFY